ncbi:MAG: hypothetical protein PHI41_00585 [Erysipelotrichaceae bacterium]|nr:hypothetical protein [Erysipelotrichaceae bacterium]MDD3809131.1 hypothetical protein [Erysipelotrichaceae bacterium]
MKNYQSANDKSIIEVKKYLMNNLSDEQLNNYACLINSSYSVKDLMKNINRNPKVQLAIFSLIKCRLKATERFDELEEELVYLNLLIDHNYKPALDYKYSLTSILINNFEFDESMVMIIRHLVNYRIMIISDLVDYFGKRQKLDENQIEKIKVKVYLIEGESSRAFKTIDRVRIDSMGEWSKTMESLSPLRYARVLKRQQKNRNDRCVNYVSENVLHR